MLSKAPASPTEDTSPVGPATGGPSPSDVASSPRRMRPAAGAAAGEPGVPSLTKRVSDLRQWATAFSVQATHYLRSQRFYGLLGFVVLVSLVTLAFQLQLPPGAVRAEELGRASEYLSTFLALGVGGSTGNGFMVVPGMAVTWVILGAAFFGGDALSSDFSTGTGYYMLVQPVRRRVLLAGRYASATVATMALVLTYFAFGVLGTSYFFGAGTIPWANLGVCAGLALLFTLACVSLAFCLSTIVRSPALGVLLTILSLYVVLPELAVVSEAGGYEPVFSLTYGGGAIPVPVDTDFLHTLTVAVSSSDSTVYYYVTTAEGVAIMAAYLVVCSLLSLLLYERKESRG